MPQTATQQNRKNLTQLSKGKAAPLPDEAETGTEDHVYGLVSVLYHALQGAQTYDQYVADAEQAGDDELATFFEQCRDQESERASRAKALLGARIDRDEDEDEDEDEGEDSTP